MKHKIIKKEDFPKITFWFFYGKSERKSISIDLFLLRYFEAYLVVQERSGVPFDCYADSYHFISAKIQEFSNLCWGMRSEMNSTVFLWIKHEILSCVLDDHTKLHQILPSTKIKSSQGQNESY